MDFDGSDDAISLGQVLAFESNDNFTIEAWVKTSGTDIHQIISKLDADWRGWGVQINQGRLQGYVIHEYGTIRLFTVTNNALNDEVWHHIASYYNSEEGFLLYIDGVQQETTSNGSVFSETIANSGSTMIGCYDGNGEPGEFWIDGIDELRIWQGERTVQQIIDNKDIKLGGLQPNLLAYYRFDDNSSECDIVDCSVNGYHGVRQGVDFMNELPLYDTDRPDIINVPCVLDIDCTSNISEFLSNAISVFPIPTSQFITINAEMEIGAFEISNSRGQRMISGFQSQKIDISFLPPGIYILTLRIGQFIFHKKIIKA